MGDDLVIPGAQGFPLNHYRVKDGTLQFRLVYQGFSSSWRTLSTEDVLMHLVLKTAVAEWLYIRRGFRPSPALGRAA